MTAPKRRWFQFRLATLFMAMTVLCCWLALVWKDRQVVQERAAVIQFLKSYKLSNGPPAVTMLHDPRHPPVINPKPLPAALARLGAEPVLSIRIPSEMFRASKPGPYFGFDGYLRIEALFPEAYCSVEPRPMP